MSDVPKDDPAQAIPVATQNISPDDLAQLLMASGAGISADPPPNKSALRRKIILAVLVAGIGVGASIMSCVGQSFSLRQARAQEGIEQQLKEIRATCTVAPRTLGESPK